MEMRYRKRRNDCLGGIELSGRKKRRSSRSKSDHFEDLPDDLVLCILGKLSSAAESPADFISALLVNKRLNGLGVQPCVLSKASPRIFAVKAKNWCGGAEKFLKQCVDVGNIEASYTLGMIRFYCLQQRENGASLMAKAAISAHAQALYSLAVIQFNGSGGSKNNKDLRAGVSLCARAAFLGHIDAIRELGHCLQDGYGVRRNIAEGRKYLVQANARELASVLATASKSADSFSQCPLLNWHPNHRNVPGSGCPLLSDFGCNVPAPEPHPASQFLTDWFALLGGVPAEGLRLCSHDGCGRPETRRHEFRRCSVCGTVTYCSRACQALDWKLRHKVECVPMERVEEDDAAADDGNHNNDIAIAGIQE